jgi:two-component system, OmpR family, response regulator ChvI
MQIQSIALAGSVDQSAGIPDPIRVVFVEDDADYQEALAGELSDHGFAVHCFGDGQSLLAALEAPLEADVVLLDWNLPQISGIDLVPELRQRGIDLPIVFLTGHAPTLRESQALDRGAIDFIDKLRGIEVLVRRLRRAVEMTKPVGPKVQDDQALVDGELVLRPSVSRAYWNGADVGLTLGEYKIVYLLASNRGQQQSYRAIYDRLRYEGFIAGAGEDGYRVNVRSTIKRIRKKFMRLDPAFKEIETYTAFGYAWHGEGAVAYPALEV